MMLGQRTARGYPAPPHETCVADDERSMATMRAWGCRKALVDRDHRRAQRTTQGDYGIRDGALSSFHHGRRGSYSNAAAQPPPHASGTEFLYGRINPNSLLSIPRLPTTALQVDPVVRRPSRFCGGWTMTRAYHQQYQYYTKYANAGRNALTSAHHNFPFGAPPVAEFLYSDDPLSHSTRCTKIRRSASARPRVSIGVGTGS